MRVLLLVFLFACGGKETDDRYKQVAVELAQKLVARDGAGAHALLASDLRTALTAAQLQAKFDEMMQPVGSAGAVHLMHTMTEWPDKQPSDAGWAYVAIDGAEGGEGLTLVIMRDKDQLRVRQIEWGRP